MTWLVLALSLAAVCGGVAAFRWADSLPWSDRRSDWGVLLGVLLVGAAATAAIVMAVVVFVAHLDRASCNAFADNSGRETRFVRYTYWTWDCLTPQADGRWIPVDALRAQGKQ